MPSKRPQILEALMAQRDQIDARIASKKQALATGVGTPFVAKFGSGFTAKDAAQFADAIEKHGPEKALSLLD